MIVECIVCKEIYDRDKNPDFCPRCGNPLWVNINEL